MIITPEQTKRAATLTVSFSTTGYFLTHDEVDMHSVNLEIACEGADCPFMAQQHGTQFPCVRATLDITFGIFSHVSAVLTPPPACTHTHTQTHNHAV